MKKNSFLKLKLMRISVLSVALCTLAFVSVSANQASVEKIEEKQIDALLDFSTQTGYTGDKVSNAQTAIAKEGVTTNELQVAQAELYDAATEAYFDDFDENSPDEEYYDSSSWAVNYLKEMVAKGEAVDEADYKDNSDWDDFIDALEGAQDLLDNSNISTSLAETKASALEDAMDALDPSTVPESLKSEAKSLYDEAEDLLDDVTNKRGAQIQALNDAMEAYEELDGDNLISDWNNVIVLLEDAIEKFNQVQGWYQVNGAWMYGEGDSYLSNGWADMGSYWSYFDENGIATQSEWLQMDDKWYYFDGDCGAEFGWAMIDGAWYYFDDDNAMRTGWMQSGNSRYYFASSGKMVAGGWAEIGGKYYYFDADGVMATNTMIDGYAVGADGAWI